MDHGGGHEMPAARCSMNMLWNTQIVDTCIVFRSWHIYSSFTFLLSFITIVLLGITYEYLRKAQRTLDIRVASGLVRNNSADMKTPSTRNAEDPPKRRHLSAQSGSETVRCFVYPVPTNLRIQRSVLYGVSVFLSFFLMLVFMTYNAYLIAAVVIGASLGHYIYGGQLEAEAILVGTSDAGKNIACC
ncbi:hypothetical protein BS47DRAFT_1370217 [Hydnum rufescens UP504]|uniref:Copper transport protein n=1 Tax=Hydnum rufescens UP504 TaxID=1448309 RepID=A0A9P6BCV4_9AGAM|nr:hypothetical protein BS47DRAFT_1370217 [Hydnum rufescens UP504]